MEVVKFGALAALAGVLSSLIGDTAAAILGLTVIGGAVGWLWRKVLRPSADLHKLLEGLPAWMKKTTEQMAEVSSRLERGDEKFHSIHDRLDVLEQQASVPAEQTP